jgi:hypothetical protein
MRLVRERLIVPLAPPSVAAAAIGLATRQARYAAVFAVLATAALIVVAGYANSLNAADMI